MPTVTETPIKTNEYSALPHTCIFAMFSSSVDTVYGRLKEKKKKRRNIVA